MQIRQTGRATDSLDAFCHRGIGEKLWLAYSQTDGAEQTDRRTGGRIDAQTGRAEQQTERQAERLTRQTCTVGSRTDGWHRKETWGQ